VFDPPLNLSMSYCSSGGSKFFCLVDGRSALGRQLGVSNTYGQSASVSSSHRRTEVGYTDSDYERDMSRCKILHRFIHWARAGCSPPFLRCRSGISSAVPALLRRGRFVLGRKFGRACMRPRRPRPLQCRWSWMSRLLVWADVVFSLGRALCLFWEPTQPLCLLGSPTNNFVFLIG